MSLNPNAVDFVAAPLGSGAISTLRKKSQKELVMSDWRERIKKVREKRDQEAAKEQEERDAAAAEMIAQAALLPQQIEFSQRIATEVLSSVMQETNMAFTDEPNQPTIERTQERVVTVVSIVNGHRVAINVWSLPDGRIQLVVFFGKKGRGYKAEFDLTSTNEEIADWFANLLAGFLEGDVS